MILRQEVVVNGNKARAVIFYKQEDRGCCRPDWLMPSIVLFVLVHQILHGFGRSFGHKKSLSDKRNTVSYIRCKSFAPDVLPYPSPCLPLTSYSTEEKVVKMTGTERWMVTKR
jgi:hypothetical protein